MRTRYTPIAFTALVILSWPAIALAAGEPAHCEQPSSFLADGWLWAYLATFGAGFLTSLTPCVYPMIPIVVGIFGARDDEVTRAKAFILATLYVLGMGVMYSILGIVFALIGKQFGSILANPWVVVPLVVFYAVLAASMFGAFELNLPASWQAKLNQVGGKGYAGAFGMGLVGGLTAAPCTGPILAGILGWVAQTQNVLAGSTLLFTYAIGMGILFWVIAAFTVALPKSGRWMEWVKSIGGTALLAVALYFLRPIIPALENFGSSDWTFLVGSLLLIAGGILLGAMHLTFHEAWPIKLRKAAGVLLVVAGTTGVISWLLTPDRRLDWQTDEQTAFQVARAEGKGVMIDFAADWCAPCKELEHTFAEPGVYETIVDSFVPLKFDVSKGTESDYERQERYNAATLPSVVFLDANGNEIARVDQYLPGDRFIKTLEPAAKVAKGLGPIESMDPCEAEGIGAIAPGSASSSAKAGDSDPVPSARTEPAQPAASPATPGTPAAQASGSPHPPVLDPDELEKRASKELVPWLDNDVAAFVEAEFSGKGVLIDFYASWCPPCVEMHKTYADPRVAAAIEASYVPVRFDVSAMSEADQALLANYKVEELPALIILSPDNEEITRITNFMDPETFVSKLPK